MITALFPETRHPTDWGLGQYSFTGFGIFNGGGTVSITNSAVVDNAAPLPNSAVVDNAAPQVGFFAGAGGGIYNGGTMFIADSTVAGNANGTFGGGIANFGKLTLQSVTVARNQVAGFYATDYSIHWRSLTLPGCDPFGNPNPGLPDFSGCITGGGGIWTDPAATTTVLSTAVALNTLVGFLAQRQYWPRRLRRGDDLKRLQR